MHGGPCGTENLQNDHWLVKYFGNIWRPCSLARVSSILKMCMVPWSDDTHIFVDDKLKLMQNILAWKWSKYILVLPHIQIWAICMDKIRTWWVPRRNSATLAPSLVSKIRMSVPRSPAVAKRVPCMFSARHVTADSCAIISNGARSVFARSTICRNTFEMRKNELSIACAD